MVELDPGAASERTALAWQRTALSVLSGAAVLARLTFDLLGLWALVGIGATVPLCVWVFYESRGRYRHDAAITRRVRPRGGRSPAALALAVTVLGLIELGALLRT